MGYIIRVDDKQYQEINGLKVRIMDLYVLSEMRLLSNVYSLKLICDNEAFKYFACLCRRKMHTDKAQFLFRRSHEETVEAPGSVKHYNGLNKLQDDAVNMSLCKLNTFVNGPPGTGKTTTLRVLINEFHKYNPSLKILCVAPSNAALLALGSSFSEALKNTTMVYLSEHALMDISYTPAVCYNQFISGDILVGFGVKFAGAFRHVCTSERQLRENLMKQFEKYCSEESGNSIKDLLESIWNNSANYNYQYWQLETRRIAEAVAKIKLAQATILLVTSVKVMDRIFDRFRPSLIVCDEAGYTFTSQLLLAIALRNKETKIVLAGDPKQSQPFVHDAHVIHYSCRVGVLETMISNNPNAGVMLKIQYRMHTDIRKMVSYLYYDNELKDYTVSTSNNRSRIVFIPLSFNKSLEGNRTGYENVEERSKIYQALRLIALYVNLKNVCVLTFYNLQKELLLSEMRHDTALKGVKVKSVDSAIGTEYPIVLISTVRAAGKPGFVNDAHRWCVALSRAKFMLVIFGCEVTLAECPWVNHSQAVVDYLKYTQNISRTMEELEVIAKDTQDEICAYENRT